MSAPPNPSMPVTAVSSSGVDSSNRNSHARQMPILRQRSVDPAAFARLTAGGVHPVLARVLAARGVNEPSDIDDGLDGLVPPTRLLNIDAAARVLADAIRAQKKCLVVADFDADGATACAVAVRGLRRFGAHVEFLVPDRFTFGYGLTPALVAHAAQRYADDPIDLIITVDNGISSITGVNAARELGIDVLITDHHLPGAQLPNALIVNPNHPDCHFPSKNLAGVGVMFYVLLGLRAHLREIGHYGTSDAPRLDDLLPIVALGTVADVVKLDANNRRLVSQGLRRLRKGNSFAGLNALFQVANVDIRLANASHFGFAIGPRLNAAGRLSDMSIGIRCLLSDDVDEAMRLAEELDTLNKARREIESDAREQAVMLANAVMESTLVNSPLGGDSGSARFSIVLHDPSWHPGIVGLIAGRLKESFHRPVIVFADDQDPSQIKGSCRSIPGVHIRDVLERIDTQHPGLIRTFGGHAMAAGLAIAKDRLDEFRQRLEATVSEFASPEDLHQVIETDGSLDPEFIRLDLASMIAQHIWGQGFPSPVFVNRFQILQQRRLKEKHLKLLLAQADSEQGTNKGASRIEAIWFNAPQDLGPSAHLAYRLAVNDWQGTSSVQLEIVALA
jgi:single-stranded-DNA-specific exonuclease